MTDLILVLAAPILGPLLYGALHGRAGAVRLVDGFVYLAVPALVAWQIIPTALEQGIGVVLLLAALGLLIPTVLERASRALAARTDDFALVAGLSGVVLHEIIEGAAFAPTGAPTDRAFAVAVFLHRVPVGLVIWWLIRPRHGAFWAAAGIASLVAATLVGVGLGTSLPEVVGGETGELYRVIVAGSLLHVVFHQGRADHRHHDHEHDPGDHDGRDPDPNRGGGPDGHG